jgi:hypothetical protein
MRKLIAPALAALALALAAGATAANRGDGWNNDNDGSRTPATTLAVFGDSPYSAAQFAQWPTLISRINADPNVGLVVHLGDIHSGSMLCTDEWNQGIYNSFQTFADPLVYTPGDNEWTDCNRKREGTKDPVTELAKIRALFFAQPGTTLGGVQKRVAFESRAFPENVMWAQSNVVLATIDLPGSNNDLVPWYSDVDPTAPVTPRQALDVATRTAADLAWLQTAFARADEEQASGVVIGMQADMWNSENDTGTAPVRAALASLAARFGKPVLLLEGDSHVFTADHPIATAPNVTRIVVSGSAANTTNEWLKLTIDPATPAVFSWTRVSGL